MNKAYIAQEDNPSMFMAKYLLEESKSNFEEYKKNAKAKFKRLLHELKKINKMMTIELADLQHECKRLEMKRLGYVGSSSSAGSLKVKKRQKRARNLDTSSEEDSKADPILVASLVQKNDKHKSRIELWEKKADKVVPQRHLSIEGQKQDIPVGITVEPATNQAQKPDKLESHKRKKFDEHDKEEKVSITKNQEQESETLHRKKSSEPDEMTGNTSIKSEMVLDVVKISQDAENKIEDDYFDEIDNAVIFYEQNRATDADTSEIDDVLNELLLIPCNLLTSSSAGPIERMLVDEVSSTVENTAMWKSLVDDGHKK